MKHKIIITESMLCNAIRESLNELATNANVKLARKLFIERNPELQGSEAHNAFMATVNQLAERNDDIENCTNGSGKKSYFLPGCMRLYLENPDTYSASKMSMILNHLSNTPNETLSQDFNGVKSIDDLVELLGIEELFGKNIGDNAATNLASMEDNGKAIHIGNYTICPTFTWDVMYNFLTKRMPGGKTAICYIGNFKSFMSNERNNGTRAIYMCVKDGFEKIESQPGIGGLGRYPWDEFGMSVIAISVPEGGKNCEVCCRWNNGARGQSMPDKFIDGTTTFKRPGMPKPTPSASFMSPQQIEKYVLNGEAKFEDVFKPFNEETQNFRNSVSGKLKNFLYYGSKAVNKDERDKFFKDHEDIWNNIYKDNSVPSNFNWDELLNKYKQYGQSGKDVSGFVAECVRRTINEMLKR